MLRHRDHTGDLLPGERVAGEDAVLGHYAADGSFLIDGAAELPPPSPSYLIAPEPGSGLADHLGSPSDVEAAAAILGQRNLVARAASRSAPPPRAGSFHPRSLLRK